MLFLLRPRMGGDCWKRGLRGDLCVYISPHGLELVDTLRMRLWAAFSGSY